MLFSQQVIAHTYKLSISEDGNPKWDADGVKNSIVVWKSGAVHVVNGSYLVEGEYSTETNDYKEAALIVEPGAIIKFAASIETDNNGNITKIIPAMNLSYIGSIKSSALILDGVTVTAVDDDEAGGDTDGQPGYPAIHWGSINLGGGNKDVIRNCTIKYCEKLGGFGSIIIDNNNFINSGGMAGEVSGPHPVYIELNSAPVITNNKLDGGGLDLMGMSPVISGNTLRNSSGIKVGPRLKYGNYDSESAGPIMGKTEIVNNRLINCYAGISVEEPTSHKESVCKKTPPFSVSIRNNIIEGTSGSISVGFSNKAEVAYNEISTPHGIIRVMNDYRSYNFTNDAVNGIRINYNKFSSGYPTDIDSPVSYKYWSKGLKIDAQHNYWGDPSGPQDKSAADGLYNPNGKGLRIGNGIDYRNFIGASEEVIPDAIRISAEANSSGILSPTEQLVPGTDYTFKVKVEDYKLLSAPTGKIAVMIKDDCGQILNGGGTVIDVNNVSASMDVPPIDLKMPELAAMIIVEASLAPDAEKAVAVYSNSVPFKVKQTINSFRITGITDAASNSSPSLIQDSKITLKFEFNYTLSGSANSRIELDLKERITGPGTVLQDLPSASIDIAPGINQTAVKTIEVVLPLRDAAQVPANELYYLVTMKNSEGKLLGKQTGVLLIRKPNNFANIFASIPRNTEDLKPNAGYNFRRYFLVGEVPLIVLKCSYRIDKPNITNWQILIGPLDVYDRSGKLLYSYMPSQNAHWTGLKSTNGVTNETNPIALKMPDGAPPIPAGAYKMTTGVSLIDPDKGIKIFTDNTYENEIRNPNITVKKDMAPGSSQVSFEQIPIKLDITNSASAGRIIAHEFQEQFRSTQTKNILNKSDAGGLFSRFIPLNRFWSVYDTLNEGSFSALITITYDPSKDFPFSPEFTEDSLVIISVNPNNNHIETLPSTLNKADHTLTADYQKFYDLYIIASKTSSPTDVKRMNVSPAHFALYQNYPNPFNPTTTITYSIAGQSNVVLKVYDMLGRIVTTLINEEQVPNEYKIQFNAISLPSGIYILTIQAGQYSASKKLIILK